MNKLIATAIGTATLLASQGGFAHTRLQLPTIVEGLRTYNATVISHGCHDPVTGNSSAPAIAHTVVFPSSSADAGFEPTVSRSDGGDVSGGVEAFVPNWGSLNRMVKSRDVWTQSQEKFDSVGNRVGFSMTNGKLASSGTSTEIGLGTFRTDAVTIDPASCAKSVKFIVAAAEVCQVTPESGFNDETVNMWTPAVGSKFDGVGLHGYNSPASLIVTRDLVAHPLDVSCGDGFDVTVTPSANQINRDLPIFVGTKQYWPGKSKR